MNEYFASMPQNHNTLKRYAQVQMDVFHPSIKLCGAGLAVALVLIGAFAVKTEALSLLLIFIGCVVFTNLNAPGDFIANRVNSLFHGKYPTLFYQFSEDSFLVVGSKQSVPYKKLIKLVEDDEYIYLFQSSRYGNMIKKSSVQGTDKLCGLRDHLAEKTGLKWRRPPTILNFRLQNVWDIVQKKDHSTGSRL